MKTTTKPTKKKSPVEAMQEEITDLKKQLENCLPSTGFKFPRTHRFDAVAQKIVQSVFETCDVFVPIKSKSCGRYDEKHKKYIWGDLEREIYRADLDDYWIKPAFRKGVELVSEAHRELETEFGYDNVNKKYARVEAADLANTFLHFKYEANIEALECLMEVIPKLKMDTDTTVDLMLSIGIILFVLKLDGIDRTADGDDEEEETK